MTKTFYGIWTYFCSLLLDVVLFQTRFTAEFTTLARQVGTKVSFCSKLVCLLSCTQKFPHNMLRLKLRGDYTIAQYFLPSKTVDLFRFYASFSNLNQYFMPLLRETANELSKLLLATCFRLLTSMSRASG